MHRGGRGRLSSLFLWRSALGGALQHQEGVRPAGGMHPQKHRVGCLPGASKFPGRNWFPLGFWLGDRRVRWRLQVPLFPAKLSSAFGAQQLSLPLSSSPPNFRAELLTYNLPDVKSRSVRTHSARPLRFCKPDSGGSAWLAGHPSAPWLPPTSSWSAHHLAALPTLFRGPLVCAWLRKLRSASLLAVFCVI